MSRSSERRNKVQVWVYCQEASEILFLLLQTNAARESFWQPVTGSVENGEEIAAAAAREMKEETGFDPKGISPVSEAFEFESRGERVREFSFLAEVPASWRNQVEIDPKEHSQFEWLNAEKALSRLRFESNARVLRDALKFLGQRKESK